MSATPVVPLRVVPPPTISGIGPTAQTGTKDREGLLGPLSMRERLLVCAIADALAALGARAQTQAALDNEIAVAYTLDADEKQAVLGLLIAFKDATGCAWTEAEW